MTQNVGLSFIPTPPPTPRYISPLKWEGGYALYDRSVGGIMGKNPILTVSL